MKEWIVLRNTRLLTLEEHDLQLGWHAFLWYGKSKMHSYFQRNALLLIWEKIREHYLKIPVWLSTMEALIHPNINMRNIVRYKDILNEKGELKTKQELNEQGMDMVWYSYMQI
uniref:Uncharacterized protein n=1 Tax=Micrurus surinamensis TaxID=129470 RepID=A0A2D4PBP5_MICSU